MINTLDFSETQFEHILNSHCSFIKNPINYLKSCDGLLDTENMVSDDEANDTDELENILLTLNRRYGKRLSLRILLLQMISI